MQKYNNKITNLKKSFLFLSFNLGFLVILKIFFKILGHDEKPYKVP